MFVHLCGGKVLNQLKLKYTTYMYLALAHRCNPTRQTTPGPPNILPKASTNCSTFSGRCFYNYLLTYLLHSRTLNNRKYPSWSLSREFDKSTSVHSKFISYSPNTSNYPARFSLPYLRNVTLEKNIYSDRPWTNSSGPIAVQMSKNWAVLLRH